MSEFRFTRPDNFPPIVKNLIIINVLMYVAQLTLASRFPFTEWVMLWPLMPQKLQGLLAEAGVINSASQFRPYQLLTHMFAHSPQTLFHIVFNMFTLWMFGKVLETVWGGPRFLLFYIASGLGAAALHLTVQYLRCQELLTAFTAAEDRKSVV